MGDINEIHRMLGTGGGDTNSPAAMVVQGMSQALDRDVKVKPTKVIMHPSDMWKHNLDADERVNEIRYEEL